MDIEELMKFRSMIITRWWRCVFCWVLSSYFAPGRGTKYCDLHVCLSVCLSDCPLACFKSDMSKLHRISLMCCLWSWIGPPLMTV